MDKFSRGRLCCCCSSSGYATDRLPITSGTGRRSRVIVASNEESQHDNPKVLASSSVPCSTLNGSHSFASHIKLRNKNQINNETKPILLPIDTTNSNKMLNSPSSNVRRPAAVCRRTKTTNTLEFLKPLLIMAQISLILSATAIWALESEQASASTSAVASQQATGSSQSHGAEQETTAAANKLAFAQTKSLANEHQRQQSSQAELKSINGAAVANKETLQVAESTTNEQQQRQQQQQSDEAAANGKYSPPVNPADLSSQSLASSDNTASTKGAELSELQQTIVQQKIEESAPAVSGLGEENQAAVSNSRQQSEAPSDSQDQEQQQQQSGNSQQRQLAVDQLQPEAESIRLHNNENEVSAGERFGRKTGSNNEQPTTPQSQQQQQQQVSESNSQRQAASKGGRSMKRAFAGHMGVFGRKRAQGEGEQRQAQDLVEEQQREQLQQHQQKLAEQLTKSSSIGSRSAATNREHHYHQQQTTRAPGAPKTKLKSADYPDYREILIQPDQAERQQQQQHQQQLQKSANPNGDEQQRIEPGQVSDAEANEATENQLQQESTTVVSDLGQQATDQSVQIVTILRSMKLRSSSSSSSSL